MAELGATLLLLAFLLCLYILFATSWGIWQKSHVWLESAKRGTLGVFALVTLASLCLWHLLLAKDFQIAYVAENVSRSLSSFYTATAFWGGQAGSLLFWAWILSLYCFVLLVSYRKRTSPYLAYAVGVLAVVQAFFLSLVVFVNSPFTRLPMTPADGHGLNPLLQNGWMSLHPPTLYFGFVGLTIPFAFAMAALMSGRLSADWMTAVRKWTLVAWVFLTIGNLFGGRWAYLVLGWGGYWGWDPVENAAIMPWFVTTAYLHSVMIQEKRGMLKIWNFVLVVLAFLLTIFGTFITRSGLVSSVHSFTQSNLGIFFAWFLGGAMLITFGLLLFRLPLLKNDTPFTSFLSREGSFLVNNLILLGIAFAIFWGTIFPMISEAVQGVRVSIGAPFFNQVVVPIGLVLVLLMGIGPLIAWRRASRSLLWQNFSMPVGVLFGVGLLCALLFGVRSPIPLVAFSLCGFVVATIFQEFFRGIRVVRKNQEMGLWLGFWTLLLKNRRRYGGYLVHLGIVLMVVGFTGNAFNLEQEASLVQGESFRVREYLLTYTDFRHYPTPSKHVVETTLAVRQGGRFLKELHPSKYFFPEVDQPMTDVSIHSSLRQDLYVILAGFEEDGRAIFKAYLLPLVIWVWIGGAITVLGGFFLLLPAGWLRRP